MSMSCLILLKATFNASTWAPLHPHVLPPYSGDSPTVFLLAGCETSLLVPMSLTCALVMASSWASAGFHLRAKTIWRVFRTLVRASLHEPSIVILPHHHWLTSMRC